MALAMGANLLYRTAYMNAAVTINPEMITYAAQSALPVPAVNIRHREVSAFLGRTAMNDDFFYLTHAIEYYLLKNKQIIEGDFVNTQIPDKQIDSAR